MEFPLKKPRQFRRPLSFASQISDEFGLGSSATGSDPLSEASLTRISGSGSSSSSFVYSALVDGVAASRSDDGTSATGSHPSSEASLTRDSGSGTSSSALVSSAL